MAMWKKALVLVLASLVVALPVVTEVTMARPLILGVFPTKQAAQQALGASPAASQSSVVLPQGDEMSDDELLQTEGEFWFAFIIAFCFGAAFATWHEYYGDEDRGVDWDDAPEIVAGGLSMAGGYLIGYYAP